MIRCSGVMFTTRGWPCYEIPTFNTPCWMEFLIAALAQPIFLKERHPTHYSVQSGDTVQSVSKHFLKDPKQWWKLWEPSIAHRDKLYPGDVVILTTQNDQPHLRIQKSDIVKLSPKIRSLKSTQTRLRVAVSAIKPFINNIQLIQPG